MEQEKSANLAKNTPMVVKFSSTLSVDHSRIKNKEEIEIEITYKWKILLIS